MHNSEVRTPERSSHFAEGSPMHPNLIAALVDDRRNSCLCSTITKHPHRPCRKCLARVSWRPQLNQRPRREARHRANPQARAWPWILTAITSILRIIGKGVSN
jgi:hypothetical protein